MDFLRIWATPLTIGAFLLMGVTGALMFFHWDMGVNKLAHEWLGWTFIIGGIAHLCIHPKGFKKHLQRPVGAAIMGLFVVLLGASFFSYSQIKQGGGNPAKLVMTRIMQTPVANLTALTQKSTADMAAIFATHDITLSQPATQTLQSLTAGNRHQQMALLKDLLHN